LVAWLPARRFDPHAISASQQRVEKIHTFDGDDLALPQVLGGAVLGLVCRSGLTYVIAAATIIGTLAVLVSALH
jgi:hypothetical protein